MSRPMFQMLLRSDRPIVLRISVEGSNGFIARHGQSTNSQIGTRRFRAASLRERACSMAMEVTASLEWSLSEEELRARMEKFRAIT
jgi:hypothetical protein